MFSKGFKKQKARVNTAQYSTFESENKPLYPSPNIGTNVSGSDKVAAVGALALPKAPKETVRGALGGAKTNTKPARVTTDLGPYGAPKGASGVTGVANTHPFQKSIGHFGKKPRMGLKAISAVKKGI